MAGFGQQMAVGQLDGWTVDSKSPARDDSMVGETGINRKFSEI
jgi:hypothetical protein